MEVRLGQYLGVTGIENSTPHTSSINLIDGLEDVRSRGNSFIFFQALLTHVVVVRSQPHAVESMSPW